MSDNSRHTEERGKEGKAGEKVKEWMKAVFSRMSSQAVMSLV